MITIENYLLRTDKDIFLFAYQMKEDPEKEEYCGRVYKKLLGMLSGQQFDIENQLKPTNIQLFINCVCLFIQERPDLQIQFSNDFTQIIRK